MFLISLTIFILIDIILTEEIMRCSWCNEKNKLYVDYHDNEWGKLNLSEKYLFEMLTLESFQAGLSWECVLNKREAFRLAYDDFNLDKVCAYTENKMLELRKNPKIIRNKLKIKASIVNARIFKAIQNEFGSFQNYLRSFWNGEIIFECDKVTSPLSDSISADLYKRGMRFVGSVIIYSFLQAVGIINSHEPACFANPDGLHRKPNAPPSNATLEK